MQHKILSKTLAAKVNLTAGEIEAILTTLTAPVPDVLLLAEKLLGSINSADPLKADLIINDLRKQCEELIKQLTPKTPDAG